MEIEDLCVKPLFEKWLEEWKELAVQRNMPIQHNYAKALANLRQYPLPIKSGKCCLLILNFGPKLCKMLDKKLEQYKAQHKQSTINNLQDKSPIINCNDNYNEPESKIPKLVQSEPLNEENKSKKIKNSTMMPVNNAKLPYKPEVGSGSYAILITMYKKSLTSDYPGFMYKKDIILAAEADLDCKLKTGSLLNYSGWCGMTTLVEENLVTRKSSPTKFSLTEAGLTLAKCLHQAIAVSASNSEPKNSGLEESEDNFYCEKDTKIIDLIDNYDNNFKYDVEVTKNVKISGIVTTNVTSETDTDNDYIKFCEENAEPTMTIKKNIHFLFTKEIDSNMPLNEISDKLHSENFPNEKRLESESIQKKTEKTIRGNGGTAKSSQQQKNLVDEISETFFLLANNFDIILLVDTQETCGGKTKPKNDNTISELSKSGILYEVRSLKVGDFAWIAKCRITSKELILPYIVERKRMDDLSSSIKDGRYHEQKFRLRHSGIENVIYLIENCGSKVYGSIPETSLLQAAVNSLIQDNFNVKFTRNHRDSMFFLNTMTKMLTNIYEGQELWSCPKNNPQSGRLMEFNEFNKAAVKTKNYKVQQMLTRQLLQLKGVSIDKATAISELYPTPKILAEAFRQSDEKLLANVESSSSKRKLGPIISKTFHQLYTSHTLS